MRLLIGLSTIFALGSTVFAACYFPNGGEVDSDTACDPNAIESACCYVNQACLSNGLCVSDPHDPVKARLHRGTCTDKAWRSGNCPRQCLDINNNGVPVYSCNSTSVDSYCCYDNCECATPFEVFSFNQSPADVYTVTIIGESYTQTHISTTATSATSSSASGSAPTSASIAVDVASSTISASTTSTAPESTSQNSLNTTALGAGLGVGIPILAVLLVGAFFLWRRKKAASVRDEKKETPIELSNEEYPLHTKHNFYADSEVPGDTGANELSATQEGPFELPTTGRSTPRGPGQP
ncbi:hypothetical protein BKA66DRAFT_577790 [Pyrenochaeta sp. MPI-SDFR-AT-0127]|nr:hypothetical protein BKA66DRAFT_577790 [Pyrenochaeta sp. MPI-SDFR-AT-0127]